MERRDWQKKGGWAGSAARKVEGAARLGGSVASGSAGAALGEAAGLAAQGLKMLGPVGIVAGGALDAFSKATSAASDVVKSFVARGEELSRYDGRLAGAVAQADVTTTTADIKEANVLGEKMAETIRLQSEADAAWRDAILPLKEAFLWLVNEVMAEVVSLLRDLSGITDGVATALLKKLKDMEANAGASLMDGWMLGGSFLTAPAPAPVVAPGPLNVPLIVI